MRETRRKNRAGASTVALWLLALCGCPQPSWEEAMAAGQQAVAQSRYGDAERIFSAALVKAEQFGPEDLRVAQALSGLAQAYAAQNKHAEAEPAYLRALKIYQTVRGETHADVAATLNNLGVLYRRHGQYADAEPLLLRAAAIKEKVFGPEHLELALTLKNLAQLYAGQGQFDKAEPLMKRIVAIREKAQGPDHPDVAKSLDERAMLLRQMKREKEAEPLELRSQAILTGAPSSPRNPRRAR
jgi:tetratricopeptide (TPR) repeat protein